MNGPLATSQDFALAIDIGGTKAALACVDARGCLLTPVEKHLVPFDARNVAEPEMLVEIIRPYVQEARSLPGRFHGIGLSMCGNIDLATGLAALVPNLHWRGVPFGQMLRDAFQAPVFAATDVRMAALAEVLWGAAVGLRYFAWATVGTGYGGYLYLDGKLYDGAHGFAGPFGHTTWDENNGVMCGCGRRGCVETFVAGPAIARAGQQAAESGSSPAMAQLAAGRAVSTADVFMAEAAGDQAAHGIIEEAIRIIAINLGGVVNTLDLEMIVMGGGVVHASSNFVPRISRRIRDFLMSDEAKRDLRVVEESFENSSLMGAAAEVFARQGLITA